ncbi:tRNA1(Val) A37 N6-methylase TrmN6 [Anaerobacterium chartisolvens]|uniref:tRNA1(Val) A37 N6-methylase TrmN6 n=1 Tax=Anaerobacterium chartisolvens TaxID=1297424 RepID=A0A369BF21_9FIRM|nr:tRNA1(Val) A37 N6-methylase TrmN6 [Anaerobacterium chartisolvens]
MKIELLENERIDDLQYKGLKIIQKTKGFCFGVDAVLLASFADVKRNDRVADLGTGTGIISILLAGKTQAKSLSGLEIQQEMAEMAGRSVLLNDLQDRVRIICGDIKKSHEFFAPSSIDVAVSNPPYMNKGGGLVNPDDTKAISRHEIMCTLEDVIAAGSRMLVPGGQLAMVHRPERLVDIACLMRNYGIEPKYIRFVHPSPYKRANLILIKGTRGGRPQLKMMEPLYIYDETGEYSREINEIYCRDEVKK